MRGLSPNFYINISVIDLYVPTIGLPIWLQRNRWTDPKYLNRSQMYEYGNWEQGGAV
jgi:hypothetical protein